LSFSSVDAIRIKAEHLLETYFYDKVCNDVVMICDIVLMIAQEEFDQAAAAADETVDALPAWRNQTGFATGHQI